MKRLVPALFFLIQMAFSQINTGGLDEAALQNLMSGGYQSKLSMEEMLYIQQMLGQERKSGTNSLFQMKDSTNLFLDTDSALGMPLPFSDTLSYVMVVDSIALDSLDFYNDIEEIRKMTTDGKRRIVLRKKRVPRNATILRRYETEFFKNANPSVFSGVTSGVGGDYPIKPGDELVLTIWGGVEKEARLLVNNQGKVTVESAGMVSLNGLTLAQAEGILKTKLSKVYSGIRSGQTFVNLRLEALSPIKVFLLGEVEKPGAYVFYGNTTVFQALYMSGGPNKEGSVRYVQIARKDSSFTIDLYDYLMYGKNANGAILFDGDIVFLPRAKILAEVDGAIGRPAIYELKEGEGVAQLLSFAGSINPDAAEQNMVLKRIYPNGRKDYETILKPKDYINGKESYPLKNGDALMVFKSAEESILNATILGAIKYPGTYQLKDSMTVMELVEISGGLLEAGYSGRVHILRTMPRGGYQLFSQNLEGEKALPLEPKDTLIVYSLKNMFRPDSVSIGGAVAKPGYYQYYEEMDAKDLVLLAGGYLPDTKKGHLFIGRLSKDGRRVENSMHSVPENYDNNKDTEIKLLPWDHVEIPYDSSFYRPELVILSGNFRNPGVYSLSYPEETLENLIKRAGGFSNEAYIDGAKFFRKSIIINDSMKLDSTFGLVGVDFSKATKKDSRNNIGLMNGDSIHVPQQSISVRVTGEVGATTNVLWRKGAKAKWYIDQAGGFAVTGDKDRVMIKYANGTVALASSADREPDPGSEIFVPYKKPPEEVQWTQIVSAFATVAGGLGSITTAIATIVLLNRR